MDDDGSGVLNFDAFKKRDICLWPEHDENVKKISRICCSCWYLIAIITQCDSY